MYQRKLPKEYYCTVDYALDVFGGKWKPRLLCILSHHDTIRYSALKEAMDNISDAALADSLKELQENGIVVRHQYNEMPVRVEYSLSDKGKTLLPVLGFFQFWMSFQNGQLSMVRMKQFIKENILKRFIA